MSQRQELIEKAFEQFKQFGFKNVTMDDLSRSLGISKKTLYEIFADKDELVLESVKYMLASNQEKTQEAFQQSKNAIEQIIRILVLMENMIRGMNLICYFDLQRHYSAAYKYLQQHKEAFLKECITSNLQQGIREGYYREDIDIEVMARFRMESSMLVFQNNLFPSNDYDIVRVNTQIFAHYMYGIATLKGHKMITNQLQKRNR
jgi:AcrR family transcriptional regulator